MEIHPTPDQEALIREALAAGRFARAEDAIREALALWEERERARAEFRASLDEAETSLVRGEGTEIATRRSRRALAGEIIARTCARLAGEPKVPE